MSGTERVKGGIERVKGSDGGDVNSDTRLQTTDAQARNVNVNARAPLVIDSMVWEHSDAVLFIERASFGADAWTEGQFWSELGAPAELKRYLVALRGGDVVGYAAVQFIAPEAEVLTVAVHPEHRGQGIAAALVAALETAALGRRCTLMHLEVEQSNAAARGLYEHLGYCDSGSRPNYYGRGRDAILMSKPLGTVTASSEQT